MPILPPRHMVTHITTILKKDASTKIKVLQEIIKIATESYNPSYAKTWAAKTLAIADIYGNWDESYAELPRYLAAVKVGNPGTEYVINTTRAPGLMSYMPIDPLRRPPYVYHRYCARHIGANFMRRYNKKVGIQVKVTAMEVQKRKYKRQLSKMINWDDGKIHKDLTDLDQPKWSLAYDGSRRYGSCTTNVSKDLNGVLKEARHLPITVTIMTTFYKSVEYFFSKVEGARQRKDNNHILSKFAMDKFEH
ncbi:hypothetical protein Vadar_004237 [Vaccinium darrowii]|uniref:Uncharacterized protein n=1 Tax=Vaccinium darrowii TaxID=229202 RepID=A0ACB7ZH60_9ERIC|nr:hypothetical protein Vadar_004237 [Vaccinium darrowii]